MRAQSLSDESHPCSAAVYGTAINLENMIKLKKLKQKKKEKEKLARSAGCYLCVWHEDNL